MKYTGVGWSTIDLIEKIAGAVILRNFAQRPYQTRANVMDPQGISTAILRFIVGLG
jgi:hypothetical protein